MLTPSPALPVTVKSWGTCQTTQISAVSTFSAKSSFCVWIGFISRPSSDGFPIWLSWNVGLGVGAGGGGWGGGALRGRAHQKPQSLLGAPPLFGVALGLRFRRRTVIFPSGYAYVSFS